MVPLDEGRDFVDYRTVGLSPRRWGLAFVLGVGCSSSTPEEAPQCVPVKADCAPLYEPSYEAVFARTLNPTCGVAGSSCHQSPGEGTKGGLAFDTPDVAYATLTDTKRTWRLVDPGNPGCSKIVYRISAHDLGMVMPPGRPLSAAEQCAITSWIAKGASR